MKPICVPCQRFYRPKKNGFYFLEGMPKGAARPKSGTAEPENWKPYKLWVGDLWECLGCGTTLISGTAERPIAEHYQSDFITKTTNCNGWQFQVNDC